MSVVEWSFLAQDAVRVGDLVSTDAGGMPIYRVTAVEEGMVRVRDEPSSDERVVPTARLHWRLVTG